jgi:hypothetical protein
MTSRVLSLDAITGKKIDMAFDPWSYAKPGCSEHAEQTALFMWANMAMRCGLEAANNSDSYNKAGVADSYCDATFDEFNPKSFRRFSTKGLFQLKWLHAIHNQGHGDAVRGNRARAEGVKPGVADVLLPWPMVAYNELGHCNAEIRHGLYIELKKKDSGVMSEIQLEFQRDLRSNNYAVECAHGWLEARARILEYLEYEKPTD